VAAGECRSIFRPFRRGRGADVTAGGVGLGLALAERWARLLGGHLTLCAAPAGGGACFRLELPIS
jgi:signal transduction histidine kinase